MNIVRLLVLAGLSETISNNPRLNAEIERRLDQIEDSSLRPFILDALEAARNGPDAGIEPKAWIRRMMDLGVPRDRVMPVLTTTLLVSDA